MNETLRIVNVDGILGYFHGWFKLQDPSVTRPDLKVYALVEFPERIAMVLAESVVFEDRVHDTLIAANERKMGFVEEAVVTLADKTKVVKTCSNCVYEADAVNSSNCKDCFGNSERPNFVPSISADEDKKGE